MILVADVRFVLDSIQEMNTHGKFWGGHIDMSKIGIVGHSMGGTTAALATKEEPRILAGVNLDGSTFPGMNGDVRPVELHKPLLFIATEEHASGEGRAREYSGSERDNYHVVVPGTDHMSFSDKRLVQRHFSLESEANSSSLESALLAARNVPDSWWNSFLGSICRGNLHRVSIWSSVWIRNRLVTALRPAFHQ